MCGVEDMRYIHWWSRSYVLQKKIFLDLLCAYSSTFNVDSFIGAYRIRDFYQNQRITMIFTVYNIQQTTRTSSRRAKTKTRFFEQKISWSGMCVNSQVLSVSDTPISHENIQEVNRDENEIRSRKQRFYNDVFSGLFLPKNKCCHHDKYKDLLRVVISNVAYSNAT